MTSTSGTPDGIDTTTAYLRAELPRLESQQQALEQELATVTARLESVRTALNALQALAPAPGTPDTPLEAEEEAGDVVVGVPVAEDRGNAAEEAAAAPEAKRRPVKKKPVAGGGAAKGAARKKKAPAPAAGEPAGAGLTGQILAILDAAGDTPVRARDVAAELGRDGTPGSINAVRSTLDRLVGSSRAHRAGRGLYQAAGR
ncbi:hypothetical protein AB0O07_07395 [Streptomyces sp. NPDC093085]|uniref:hypothetical protein n=1 Tax=Streptomyces sp. NPDC093085 TaxID=3155068 RepID=UPI00343D2E04